jgi:hypothetical protein
VTRRATLLGTLGVLAAAVAVGAVVGLAPASLLGPAGALDATLGTGALGLGLLAYALHRRRSGDDEVVDEPLLADADADGRDAPGERVDAALERVAADSTGRRSTDARALVRERVRLTAERAYAHGAGAEGPDAAEAVAAGEWTDDRVAAAFLGDERGPRLPLRERLRGWLHPGRAFQRRARRAADAAHELAEEVVQ